MRLAVAVIAVATLARPAAAQVTSGTLSGTVKDAHDSWFEAIYLACDC